MQETFPCGVLRIVIKNLKHGIVLTFTNSNPLLAKLKMFNTYFSWKVVKPLYIRGLRPAFLSISTFYKNAGSDNIDPRKKLIKKS